MTSDAGESPAESRLRPLDQAARDQLRSRGGRSPHDYIPGTTVDLDRAHWLDGQLVHCDTQQDLRALWTGGGGTVAILASKLPWDSAFFGVETARLDAVLSLDGPDYPREMHLSAAVSDFLADARARGVRYLFSSVDTRDASVSAALSENGFEVIETRVTYHRSLVGFEPAESHSVRLATPADIPALQAVAVEMVNPLDRFHADPCVPRALADRLMAKWVDASVAEGFADFVIVPDEPEPGAFVTVRTHKSAWAAQGIALAQPVVLGAVLPRLRGWYLKLLSESCRRLKALGATHAYVVTQSGNRAATRTFEKAGFVPGRTELVFRWAEKAPR